MFAKKPFLRFCNFSIFQLTLLPNPQNSMLYNGQYTPLKVLRIYTPYYIRFSGPARLSIPNGILISLAIFCTVQAGRSLCFTMGCPFPPKNCSFPWGYGPRSNKWFLGPIRAHNPNSISFGSAIFALLRTVTDRSTDHNTRSVTIGRIYAHSTAVQPNKNTIVSTPTT